MAQPADRRIRRRVTDGFDDEVVDTLSSATLLPTPATKTSDRPDVVLATAELGAETPRAACETVRSSAPVDAARIESVEVALLATTSHRPTAAIDEGVANVAS